MSSFFRPRFRTRSNSNNNAKKEKEKTSNETAINVIKSIGEKHGEENRTFDSKRLDFDVKTLIALMKRNRTDKHVQRVACHTISNMAIHQEKCPIICKHNAHKSILRTVMDNVSDWKMCWLGMSAIWNLARPETCRKQFDVSTLKLIYKVINKHQTVHLVIETALGALSNLVLYEKIRSNCGKFHILQFLIQVIKQHTKHCNVATASAGLITNLAHSNEIASRLSEIGTIPLIVSIMSEHSHDTHLQRNCCAALSNMSSSSGYIHNLLECLGIERLFASLNLAALNPSSQIEPLAEQALFVIDIDWTKQRMSSLHIAAKKGLYYSVYKCMLLMYKQQQNNINTIDSNGNTPCHYSIEHQHENVTKLLISRGADIAIINKLNKNPMDLMNNDNESMNNAVNCGLLLLKNAKLAMNKMLCEIKICCSEKKYKIILPIDIGMIVVNYINAFEVMHYYGYDEFNRNNLNKNKKTNECLTSYYVCNKKGKN